MAATRLAAQGIVVPEGATKEAMLVLETEHKEKTRKARVEEVKRRAEQVKRLDFLVRALREAEQPKVKEWAAGVYAADRAFVEAVNEAAAAAVRAKEAAERELKPLREKIDPFMADWEAGIIARRRAEYEAARVRGHAAAVPLHLAPAATLPVSTRRCPPPVGAPVCTKVGGARRVGVTLHAGRTPCQAHSTVRCLTSSVCAPGTRVCARAARQRAAPTP